MFWYILAFVVSILFASAAQKLKGKSNVETLAGTFHFRSSYYCMMVLSFLPIFIVAAIRYEVGTDWIIYLDYYHFINNGTGGFSEKLFNLMNKFIGWTVNDFQGLVILVAFLSYIFLFKAIYEQSISAPLALLVFLISGSFFASINQLRQAISMPIMLYAYKYIRQKKLVPYMLWCLVAFLIHASAVVYLLLYFAAQFKPTLRRYLTIFGICLVTLPVTQFVLDRLMMLTKYAWYSTSVFNSGSTENNFYLVGFVFQMIVLVIMCYYRFASNDEDPVYDGMLNCYFLSVIALLFTPVLTQVLRVSQCFAYCQILLVPRMINREKDRTRRIVLYVLVVVLFAAKLLYDTYVLGWNGVIPYQTIFSK